ncbi:ABC transporter ATP-binding protein [Succinivibrio dextrinosolvens]|uniref:ABC transporter ATP-binding protein n=1 Tax=Succinivibrio dextrinosolvens TaxID=83771 RepID=UPI0019206D37|nr:ATP-binding cassette domain-containing protein [Succinivibrio dextrinosolvens]
MLAELKNLKVVRQREDGFVLSIRSLHLNEGEFVAITGPSGCGKSTTLDLLGMILKPDSSETFSLSFSNKNFDVVSLWGKNATDEMAKIRRQYIGYVLQTGELLPFFNVLENIEVTARISGACDYKDKIDDLLRILNISHLKKAMPGSISIGERQRVAIARAFASSPKLLLADEPTAALDPKLSEVVISFFLEAAALTKTTIVMVSHDVNLVHKFKFREIPVHTKYENNKSVSELVD